MIPPVSRLFPQWNLVLCLWLASMIGVAAAEEDAGTARMAERLSQIRKDGDPLKNPFLNRAAAKLFGEQLQALLRQPRRSVSQAVSLYFKYAYELLHAGESALAIQQFEALDRLVTTRKVPLSQDRLDLVALQTILAHLRLGEQQNCLDNHTAASCLVPIEAAGVHQRTAGSEAAARLLETYLETHPTDLRAGWLLNVAYMTLGRHPDQMPQRYVIPPSAFDSDYPLPRFPEVAGALGVDWNSLAGSVVMDDLDGDHDLDLMVSGMGLDEPLRLYRNNGDGSFTEATDAAGLEGLLGGLNMVQADYDNDGDLDVFVLRGAWFESEGNHPNSLLQNRGDGTFRDVTDAAGVLSFHPTQSAVWLDYDGDGWVDLFVGNETSANAPNPCELFHNQGDGTFREVARQVGLVGRGMIKAVGSGDFDNDGRPDLYLSCRGQPNFLYRNEGPVGNEGQWQFRNVAKELGVEEPVHSFPSWFFDYDNDGWVDIFSCGYGVNDVGTVAADYLGIRHGGARPRLYRNQGDGSFRDVTQSAGLYRLLLGMAGNFGDLDNDGFLDFYVGTGTPQLEVIVPNRMFRNDAGKRFQDVTTAGGFGHIQKGHGIAFGDLNQDGYQDVYTSLGGAYEGDAYYNALFLNPGAAGQWLKLKLVGRESNRAAIGARIQVTVRDDKREWSIYRTVNSGGSFGASPLRQEIGLGTATEVISVRIQWPGQEGEQIVAGLKPKQFYRITEGIEAAKAIPLLPIPLKMGSHKHH